MTTPPHEKIFGNALGGTILYAKSKVDQVLIALKSNPTSGALVVEADAIGSPTDAAASITADETASSKSIVSMIKAIKNLLIDISGFLYAFVVPTKTPITASITGDNTFSDPLAVDVGHYAVLDISGIVGSTVFWQKRVSAGAWADYDSFTSDVQNALVYIAQRNVELRAGVKTGGFGSGSIAIVISQG